MTPRTLILAAAAAAPLALPSLARAQPVSGVYIGAGAGYSILQGERFKTLYNPSGSVALHNPTLTFDGGVIGVGSVGYGFGNGLRLEVEGSYRQNDANKGSGLAGTGVSASGQERKYGAMVNALFDFDIALPWLFPYVGGGIGYQWAEWHDIRIADGAGNLVASNDTQGALAYQAIAGASFPIPGVPGLSVTAEYRFLGLSGDRNYAISVSTPTGSGSGKSKVVDDWNHSILLGVRYYFGVVPPPAPPAPVAAPAPAAARSYLVFFDWDRATLTDRARAIIADAASNIPKVAHTRIEVNGYTDTSGSAAYNQGLSVRRAQAVAAELVRLGVAKTEIAIQGFGETRLLVATGPGVREPQNRRVEIIIR